MAEEIITTPGGDPTPNIPNDTNADYIAVIEEMKANTVPKTEFEKLQEDRKRLLETLVRGGQATPQAENQKPDIDQLRKELYCEEPNLSNLEFWSKTLDLRDALIAKGEPDPSLPFGKKVAATAEDVQTNDKVAKIIRECINYANGDSRVFTNEMNRRTVDIVPTRRRR